MDHASVEIENGTGAGGVIVARFEVSSDSVGTVHIAGGARQRFDRFDRLTVTAPEASGHLRLFNHSPWPVDLTHETRSGHANKGQIAVTGFHDLVVAPGDQLTILPRPPAVVIPAQPVLFLAQFRPVRPRPLFAPNQKPSDSAVFLEWRHPEEGKGALLGYNVYRSVYEGDRPIQLQVLNGVPQQGRRAQVADVQPPMPYNHRYAVTAVSRDGAESLFSNVRILDWNTRIDLFDAGFVPL
ncbi:hypothetical protein [Polymorphum gilvum]|uniref:Fibronectin type-III domain-containing protein n=1 Tax=Polymorphum gilvum (strain LMG 25793 / CGMCC 1.9160 / SL003B-26A1) TaxID=991905 RepID=F2J362_POLGS|nr:hypothetical protein [Polymorphum gilvum]ADZ69869.1 hypothetical protein SL003B_1441 [Polymorphum gilvum SL003B-26A1]